MPEEAKVKKPVNEVILRSYPKVIFFYPLFLVTLILMVIEYVNTWLNNEPLSVLGIIWFIVFFSNLFVIAFDFSSTKFFILILAIILVVLLIIFLIMPNFEVSVGKNKGDPISFGLPVIFYAVMFLILGFILFFVILSTRFSFYKIERNEIYIKKGLVGSAERWPVKSLRMHKQIPDIFEYIALRAGSITLMPSKDKVIHLNTILNINKKADEIDELLSRIRVEIDDHA